MKTRRIFKLKAFGRWMLSNSIEDRILLRAVEEIESGLVDADLGGGIVKKRIPALGRGKSGGARTILAFKTNMNVFFIYGFMKNELENIDKLELQYLKKYADYLFSLNELDLIKLIDLDSVLEVSSD
ncbi:MAG: type II toxin-antitoxin system RelE/ParE family toxin [Bdellovibrionales bacterium]|nr:type II toxin-antitoxin system RelE/ParE family toxin [Bdellovibrionales bacterium]